ncbi:IPT/TIG domain-containing protein [bacterium]|nr:IPT/TIG domain-containing protein [bacterium]
MHNVVRDTVKPWRLLILLVGLLVGCPHLPSAVQSSQATPVLSGTVLGQDGYQTQGTPISEIANGATVSLINPSDGQTIATTLTQPNGDFVLAFGTKALAQNTPYLLEAIKGLSVGGAPNRAGAPAARLRTFVYKTSSGWQSLTKLSNGSDVVRINQSTTALCVIAGLRGFDKAALLALKRTITVGTPDSFAAAGGITGPEYASVWGLIDTALTLNQDPVRTVALDTATNTYARLERGPFVTDLSTVQSDPGTTITLYGSGFDPVKTNNKVYFAGDASAATVVSVNATGTQLVVKVSNNADVGTIVVQVGNLRSLVASATVFKPGPVVEAFAGAVDYATGKRIPLAGTKARNFYPESPSTFPTSVAVASGGAVFVTSHLQVFKVFPDDTFVPVAGSLSGGSSAEGVPATSAALSVTGLAADADGNLYIAVFNRIRMVPKASGTYFGQAMTANCIYTIAGTGTSGFNNDGILATTASLNNSTGVTLDAQGNVFIADTNNHRIRMIPRTGGTYFGQTMTAHYLYTIAGTGASGSDLDGTIATSARLNAPKGVAVDAQGNVFIADTSNHRVRMIPRTGATYFGQAMTANCTYTIAGKATAGYDPDGTAAASARFNTIGGVAVDLQGNVYISDTAANRRIRMVPGTGGTYFGQSMAANCIYTIAGTGTSGYNNDAILATTATLGATTGVAVDAQGNLFIADTDNKRARMIPRAGGTYFDQIMIANYIYTFAGNGGIYFGGDGGPATYALLNTPGGVAVDAQDNVYIADTGNHRIRMVPKASGIYFGQTMTANCIYTIVGTGTSGYDPDGTTVTSARLNGPRAVAVDAQGNLFIADRLNHRIRMVPQASGTYFGQAMTANCIYTIAGIGSGSYDTGVLATSARLWLPAGIALDSQGNVYITCELTSVQMIPRVGGTYFGLSMTANYLYTLAGNGSYGVTQDAVLGRSTQVWAPVAIAVNKQGTVFFADAINNGYRVIPSVDGRYFGRDMIAGYVYNFPWSAGNSSTAIAVDAVGSPYFYYTGIQKVGPDGLATVITGKTSTTRAIGALATKTILNPPLGMAFTSNGDLYFACDNSVRRIH